MTPAGAVLKLDTRAPRKTEWSDNTWDYNKASDANVIDVKGGYARMKAGYRCPSGSYIRYTSLCIRAARAFGGTLRSYYETTTYS